MNIPKISNNQGQVKFESLHRIKCDGLTQEVIKPLAEDLLEISNKMNVKINEPILSEAGHCYIDADDKADGYIMFAIMNFRKKMSQFLGNDFKAEMKGIKLPDDKTSNIDEIFG